MPSRRSAWLATGLLYLGLSSSLTQFHAYQVNFGPKAGKRAARHMKIVNMEKGRSPWAYRVAVPLAVEHPLADVFRQTGASETESREYGYLTIRLLTTALTMLLSHMLIARFTSAQMAFAGALLIGALHGPSTEHYWFQPTSGPDHVVWLTAALLTLHKRDAWLYVLIFLGAWNRETAVFAIPIYMALRWGTESRRRTLERAVVMGLLWVTPFLLLRGSIELVPQSTSPPLEYLERNLGSFEWQSYAVLFLGGWIILPIVGWRWLPAALRRLLVVMIPYVGLIFAFGRIREVRLFLPLTLAFVPASMVVVQKLLNQLDPNPPNAPSTDAAHPSERQPTLDPHLPEKSSLK